jgi:maltooligosyltrehalose trehalohydrolase
MIQSHDELIAARENPPERARRCGPLSEPSGAILWRVWAPSANNVTLVLHDREQSGEVRERRMEPISHGHFEHTEPGVESGQRYAFRLDCGPERPDPCSLFQPDGVHGPSAVIRPEEFVWTDGDWKGVSRQDLVFYELHVGTFTPEGTFEAIIPRLAELKDLGITAIELLPVAQFPGDRNWGYDGVLPYAVQNSYGGPQGLQRLVDACHAAGLALFLDVVYNHLGPEGNYSGEFGPYLTDHYKTPWGKAVNYDDADCDAVRDFVIDNVRMWLQEFHIDGLRLDAVHAIYDSGAHHILAAIKEAADRVADRRGWPASIVAESDLNDPRLLREAAQGGLGLDGQWSDDFHHTVHTILTGECQGYYSDYGKPDQLARVLESPFLYAGDFSPSRNRKHGAPPEGLSGDRFIVCIQNHDQVGNRASGDRLGTILHSQAQQRLAASLLLFAPHLPLIFMGEEYGEQRPFPFFCSFGDPPLIDSVREGRSREFAAFAWQGEVPDPQSPDTFSSARLNWAWPEGSDAAQLRHLYRDLLAARQWPALRDFETRSARLLPDPETGPILEFVRGNPQSGQLQVFFNLSSKPVPLPSGPNTLMPMQPLFSSELARYGGCRTDLEATTHLSAFECIAFGPATWTAASSLGAET